MNPVNPTYPTYVQETMLRVMILHAEARGALCSDEDGDGCCDARGCGVSMHGGCPCAPESGYHAEGCPESDEDWHYRFSPVTPVKRPRVNVLDHNATAFLRGLRPLTPGLSSRMRELL